MPAAVRQRVQALAQPGGGGDIDLTCHSDNGASWFAADPDGQAAFMTAHRPASARSRAAAAHTCLMIVCHPLHFSAWPGR
jgi:hypothetical protein